MAITQPRMLTLIRAARAALDQTHSDRAMITQLLSAPRTNEQLVEFLLALREFPAELLEHQFVIKQEEAHFNRYAKQNASALRRRKARQSICPQPDLHPTAPRRYQPPVPAQSNNPTPPTDVLAELFPPSSQPDDGTGLFAEFGESAELFDKSTE